MTLAPQRTAPVTVGKWPWPLVLLAFWYVVLSTVDLKLGPVPVKFMLTIAALLAWFCARRTPAVWLVTSLVGLGVVGIGVVIPVFGFLVALGHSVAGDPAQAHGLRDAFEESSRFVYVLFALPLMDLFANSASRAKVVLAVGPAVLLAGVTLGAAGAHFFAGAELGPVDFGPFRGSFGVEPATGTFRAFFMNQILFLPAMCMLLVMLLRRGAALIAVAGVVLILASLVIAHSRGLWTGMTAGCIVIIALGTPISPVFRRPLVRQFAVLGVLVALLVLSAPHLFREAATLVTGGEKELSASTRLDQGPELWRGYQDHPFIGSGLGAWLPSGFKRSPTTPWSFEQSYLQLLFQLGPLGLGLFFVSLSAPVRRAWKSVFAAARTIDEPFALAGLGSIVALLLGYSSNPYLLTSPGMLALGIALALLVTGRRGDEPPLPGDPPQPG